MDQPKIQTVATTDEPGTLVVTWEDGTMDRINLSELIRSTPASASLQDPALFNTVRVECFGWCIAWDGGVDLGSDTLWELAEQQREQVGV